MSENKVVKIVTDSAVIVVIAGGLGYVGKKVLREKESLIGDPFSSVMDFVKLVAVISSSIAIKDYLEDRKILPKEL